MKVSMSAVWDRATEFLGDNFGAVLAIAGTALLIPSIVDGVLSPLKPTAGAELKLGLGLLSLGLSLVSLLGQTALIALVLEPALGSRGAFARGTQRLGPMIGVSLVILLAVIVLFLPVVLLLVAGGTDLSAMSGGVAPNLAPGSALMIVLYLLVLVPVMLWLGARLTPLSGVVVAERRGLGAIGHAFRLSRGLALRLIGVILLFLIVTGVGVLAARLVVGSIMRLALGDHGPLDAASIVTAVVVAIVSTAMTTIAVAFVAKLYAACTARAEIELTA